MSSVSNFPHGFNNGVRIKNIPIDVPASGKIFWVSNNTVVPAGALTGNDTTGDGSFNRPFATIDYAIGRCTANQGDRIYIKGGHAETISGASAIAMDIAGVEIVGIGIGASKPNLTFATTATTIVMSAANCSLQNVRLIPGVDSVVTAISVTAAGCHIDVESVDASASVEFIAVLTTSTAGDRLRAKVTHRGFTTGDACVRHIVLNGCDNAKIEVDFYGNASTAVVGLVTTSSLGVEITGTIHNGTTALTKNVVDTIGSSKWVAHGYDSVGGYGFQGGAGTALAALTSASTTGLGTDGTTVTDSATTVLGAIGADNADNAFASTSVVANKDGSVLERLEALMDPLSGYNPRMGFGVTKISNMADGSGTDNLFTVTGRVLITSLTGEVTTQIGTTTTMKLRDVTNSVDLCAATTITTDVVGTMYALTSISTNILNGTGATPVVGSIPNITGAQQLDVAVIGDAQAAITLAHVLDGAGTGNVTWRLTYIPLVAGATVVAAA